MRIRYSQFHREDEPMGKTIGRFLYTAPRIFVYADRCRQLKPGKNGKMQCWDEFRVAKIAIEGGRITGIRIVNDSDGGSIAFSWKEK